MDGDASESAQDWPLLVRAECAVFVFAGQVAFSHRRIDICHTKGPLIVMSATQYSG